MHSTRSSPVYQNLSRGCIQHIIFLCSLFTVCVLRVDNIFQLNEHVRTQVLTPQCRHLFHTTTYETTHLLLHVLIYLQFWSGRLCNHTRYPGATKTYLICSEVTVNSPGNRARRSAARTYLRRRRNFRDDYLDRFRRVRNMKTWGSITSTELQSLCLFRSVCLPFTFPVTTSLHKAKSDLDENQWRTRRERGKDLYLQGLVRRPVSGNRLWCILLQNSDGVKTN